MKPQIPGNKAPHRNKTQVFLDLARRHTREGRLAEARALLSQLLALEPAHQSASDLMVHILIRSGDYGALRSEMERRLAADPSFEHVELERSLQSLLLGDMPLGWKQYEARWELPGLGKAMQGFTQPRWEGEPFPGRSLLLHWEQGLGDTLMFVRYAPMVKALGGRVLVAAQAPLADLVATCPGVDEVIPEGAPIPPFDLLLPLMSLPRVFSTGLATIPSEVPYLDVPRQVPNRKALAEALALGEGRARIGVAWAGSSDYSNDANRSMPGEALAPLGALTGVAWYSFQFDKPPAPLPGIISLQPLLQNFSDTAYALSGMDLVITVDTVLAHLAGAMGVPTLLLLPSFPDWRWMLGRDDSPWYPSIHIYRQVRAGDWANVIQRVLADLVQEDPNA